MAVDPTQSKIPRLGDGVVTTRIPLPNALRAIKSTASKISKPLLSSRLRNSSIPKSFSSDKLSEQILLQQFTTTSSNNKKSPISEKCFMKFEIGSNAGKMEKLQNHLDNDHDKEKSLVDQILTEKDKMSVINETITFCDKTHDIDAIDDRTHIVTNDRTFECSRNKFNNEIVETNDSNQSMDQTLTENCNLTFDLADKIGSWSNLNSTVDGERLLDITNTLPPFLNVHDDSSPNINNQTHLLYITRDEDNLENTVILSQDAMMEVDEQTFDVKSENDNLPSPTNLSQTQQSNNLEQIIGANNVETIKNSINPTKPRFSFGLDLTDCSLDCSIELCENSYSSSNMAQSKSPNLNIQNSFEIDESLGILTPDQMKEFLDSTTTTTNLELPLESHGHSSAAQANLKLSVHHCRIDQTPSPEELPLDPISVKTDISDVLMSIDSVPSASVLYQELSQTDSDSKMDQMTKSAVSKVSNSFITSVTSITSLDTGYQGDGEMSRPASRGADHSPSNLSRILSVNQQKIQNNNNTINWNMNAHPPIPRRQDPMTDSDFFTESDADDIFHRGDRRAQVIDGQLYGPSLQAANVFINDQNINQNDDSCMESSGIFTDVENRGDDDLLNRPGMCNENDMSPDASTDTLQSNSSECSQRKLDDSSIITPTPKSQISPSSSYENEKSNSKSEKINNNDVQFGTIIKSNSNDNNLKCDKTSTQATTTATTIIKTPNNKSSPSRKQNKNEVNATLKKHEMSKRNSTIKMNCNAATKSNLSSVVKKLNVDENATTSSRKISITTNKWDAVMTKIEKNKTLTPKKKNFSDVKSKVSCGVVQARRSPNLIKSPSDADSGTSEPIKRKASSISNRGRAYSKDSQQSSQSDISLTGGSPRITSKPSSNLRESPKHLPKLRVEDKKSNNSIKNFLSSAKKRDVRTISNSPSDLGPPSKTIGTPRSNRAITLQKRISATITSNTPTNVSANSPQNLVNQTATTITAPLTPVPIAEAKSSPPAKKLVPRRPTIQQQTVKLPLKDHNRLVGPTQTAKGTTINTNATTATAIKSSQRTSPSHNNQNGGLQRNGTVVIENGTTQINGGMGGGGGGGALVTQTNGNSVSAKNLVNLSNNIGHLNHNNNINNNVRQKSASEINLAHANKGIEALGVVIQHLVYNLDAFSCGSLKLQYAASKDELLETRMLLDDTRASCQNLEEQITHKETLFLARESELQELHRREINKVENDLSKLERTSNERIKNLEQKILNTEKQSEDKLQKLKEETESRLNVKDDELKAAKEREDELLKRITALSCTENELREKVLASETDFGDRLRLASLRERDLTDKVNLLNRQLDEMKLAAETKERELSEKLNIAQDEIGIIRRHSNRSSPEIQSNTPLTKSQTLSNSVSALRDEVESLRCVLELKQSEISDLRKQNQEYQRAADELPAAMIKVSVLESRLEDLKVQLSSKLEQEKELVSKNKSLQESYAQEIKNRSRLSLHNEELQYRLKQNSEKYTHILNEFSKSYHEQSGSFNNSNTSRSLISEMESAFSTRTNGSDKHFDCFIMEDVSPPTSPIIKGVVEKSDSVSYVLEIDDETPEDAATRVVRRAGSFRSHLNDKHTQSPIPKRQKCQSVPLSHSTSATSILRQNSDSASSPQKISGMLSVQSGQRIRSKSVSVKMTSEPKKITRSISSNSKKNLDVAQLWKDQPICSSSPYTSPARGVGCPIMQENGQYYITEEVSESSESLTPNNCRGRVLDLNEHDNSETFRPKRITCNTAALTTNRDELCPTLPSHPSVQDLKNVQNHPKESAGEAMVSGSNSEDEASSLGGSTPMEVSWSEDGDQYPSESIV